VTPVRPGGAIGVLGGGQLARMFALAALRMGYRVHVLSPDPEAPAAPVAEVSITAAYDDADALRAFARAVDVATFEFENVPAQALDVVAEVVPVRPASHVLHITQDRIREKTFLSHLGLPVTPFAPVRVAADLPAALARIGCPGILKTARAGYDGKGQVVIRTPDMAEAAWNAIGRREAVLEAFVDFERELSVVAVRGLAGECAHYGPVENRHVGHVLDVTIAPARVSPQLSATAWEIARTALDALDIVGVLCVEFFLTRDGRLLVNELAPRPHNSGHFTIEACVTSQFEQHVRAACGLPLGSTRQPQAAAMANLLGDLWAEGEPDWPAACARPGVALHLYGKREPRARRKMGHLNALGATADEALHAVLEARQSLVNRQPRQDAAATRAHSVPSIP
jgi:5-(carboxyamino)imidazole ribonucleotide synthase